MDIIVAIDSMIYIGRYATTIVMMCFNYKCCILNMK